MKIETCQFVTLTSVLEGVPHLAQFFRETDHNSFTWGDCNRSMISINTFLGEFSDDEFVFYADGDDTLYKTLQSEYGTLYNKLDGLDQNIYIDLEN